MPSEPGGLLWPKWPKWPNWPQWQGQAHVGSCMTTRHGGHSSAPWDSFNLGAMAGDSADAVAANRRHFVEAIGAQPVWLRQVHGCHVLRLAARDRLQVPTPADAAWTDEPGVACTVLVADCLPVLLAAPAGVAAAHAGWRGLAAGVLENAVQALCSGTGCRPDALCAWLGPCIGPRQFEVGADVLRAFGVAAEQANAPGFVAQGERDGAPRWLADLAELARQRLRQAGVTRISSAQRCTVEERSEFFSYRRDGVTGRMAAAIWLRG